MPEKEQSSSFKVEPFRSALLAWYEQNRRVLPWRETNDPYRIWVSETMLQQTRVDTVIPYYERFLERLPDVRALAQVTEDELLKLWEGLGYYRRARNLQKAARVLVEKQSGQLPTSATGWRELPGIGPYTAAAIASIAFGEAVAVLDGNVKRVLARLFALQQPIDKPAVEKTLWQKASELLDPQHPGEHNQAMMELGALICLPKQPRCSECPVADHCEACKLVMQQELPLRTRKRKTPLIRQVALLVRTKEGGLLIQKRREGELLAGLWELPNENLKENTRDASGILSALLEVLGIDALPGALASTTRHAYTHFRLKVSAYELIPAVLPEEKLKHLFTDSAPGTYAILRADNRDRYAIHRAHQKLI